MSSGLFGLQVKSVLPCESFTISRNWLNFGKTVSPESARPQMSKHQKPMVNILSNKYRNRICT